MIDPDEKQAAANAALGVSPSPSPAASPAEPESLEGIPPHFHPVCRQYGRAKFEQIYTIGVAQYAMNILVQRAGRDAECGQALLTLTEMLNKLSLMHCDARGWPPGSLREIDAAIRKAMDSKIIIARPGGRLDS